MRILNMLVAVLLLASQQSCHPQTSSVSSAEPSWDDRAWLDKAVRATLYGQTQLSPEDEAKLLSLPRDQAIDELMKRPEFADTVLDFNLYFEGSKPSVLKSDGSYGENVLASHAALASAMEFAAGGDYFRLFDWRIPYVIGSDWKGPPETFEGIEYPPEVQAGDRQAKIDFLLALALKDLKNYQESIPLATDLIPLCGELVDFERPQNYIRALSALGLGRDWDEVLNLPFEFFERCGFFGRPVESDEALRSFMLASIERLNQTIARLPALIAQLPAATHSLQDFARLDPSAFARDPLRMRETYSAQTWDKLQNSSTNFNRRRAAHTLRTYFCDDLTPLNIVAPSELSDHKHGSDAACASCHYKLDPMAGFYRERGFGGVDFQNYEGGLFVHDDLYLREKDDFQNYLGSWKAKDPQKEWDVGYIRSATRPELNSYGSTLEDLFAIIKRSRESKVCLAKKLASYVLGAEQVYDGRWIDGFAEKLHQAAQNTAPEGASVEAFKEVYKGLLLSKTFSERDPEANQCYDFAAGTAPSGVPCAIAFVIEKNCSSCHKGEGARAGLDLNSWVKKSDGSMGFRHTDRASGGEVSQADTLDRIKTRLSTSDPARQMPLMRAMDPVERASLFKWVDEQLRGEQ